MKAMSCTVLVALLLASTAGAQVQPQIPSRGVRPRYPGAPAAKLPAVPPDPLSQPPRPSTAARMDVSGVWKGVYSCDDAVILAELTLQADEAGRVLSGDVKFRSFPPPNARGRDAQPRELASKVSGQADPGSRTVLLDVPEGIRATMNLPGQPLQMKQRRLEAVVWAHGSELAGQFTSTMGNAERPYIVFVRPDQEARIKSLAEHVAPFPLPVKASGSVPGDAALAKWSDRFIAEYGKEGLGTSVDQISAKALPLLNDDTFKPLFGESYDTISYGKLGAGMRRAGAAVSGGGSFDVAFAKDHGYIQYMLWPSAPKLISVAAMRSIDAWRVETMGHYRSDPPAATAFEDIGEFQKAIKERAVYAWPSEKRAADESIEGIKKSMATGALAANVEWSVSRASGIPGARALVSWSQDNATMLGYCSASDRAAAQGKIDAKQDEILTGLLGPEVAKLEKLGVGSAAVRGGAEWYRATLSQFSFAAQRPPVVKAVERLSTRREQDLGAAREQILQQIAACKTTEEVDAIFGRDLTVPGDDQLAAFGPLADAGRQKKGQIQLAFQMTLFSPQEREWMDRPGHIDVVKWAGHAPSKESIRMALLRGWAFGTGTQIDDHTSRHVTRARTLGIPFPMVVRMSDESLQEFHPSQDGKGFDCRHSIVMQFSIPKDNVIAGFDEVVRKAVDTQTELMNSLIKSLSGESTWETFRLYEDGWGCPRLRENGAAEAAIDELLKRR